VLRILQVITGNLASRPATVPLPGSVPTPAGFRGRVLLDPARCLACGMCGYVCVSDAIVARDEDGGFGWAYEPGRCAFCARCFERCPGRALSMEAKAAPSYLRPGELAVRHRVPLPACPRCGVTVRPATEELLQLAFDHVTDETRELVKLCERCRRHRLQRSLAAAAGAGGNPEETKR
jgi:formate hydrogenlyase subunit 6/NADH:ubiquinone oxidoreductase subunit I